MTLTVIMNSIAAQHSMPVTWNMIRSIFIPTPKLCKRLKDL